MSRERRRRAHGIPGRGPGQRLPRGEPKKGSLAGAGQGVGVRGTRVPTRRTPVQGASRPPYSRGGTGLPDRDDAAGANGSPYRLAIRRTVRSSRNARVAPSGWISSTRMLPSMTSPSEYPRPPMYILRYAGSSEYTRPFSVILATASRRREDGRAGSGARSRPAGAGGSLDRDAPVSAGRGSGRGRGAASIRAISAAETAGSAGRTAGGTSVCGCRASGGVVLRVIVRGRVSIAAGGGSGSFAVLEMGGLSTRWRVFATGGPAAGSSASPDGGTSFAGSRAVDFDGIATDWTAGGTGSPSRPYNPGRAQSPTAPLTRNAPATQARLRLLPLTAST